MHTAYIKMVICKPNATDISLWFVSLEAYVISHVQCACVWAFRFMLGMSAYIRNTGSVRWIERDRERVRESERRLSSRNLTTMRQTAGRVKEENRQRSHNKYIWEHTFYVVCECVCLSLCIVWYSDSYFIFHLARSLFSGLSLCSDHHLCSVMYVPSCTSMFACVYSSIFLSRPISLLH